MRSTVDAIARVQVLAASPLRRALADAIPTLEYSALRLDSSGTLTIAYDLLEKRWPGVSAARARRAKQFVPRALTLAPVWCGPCDLNPERCILLYST